MSKTKKKNKKNNESKEMLKFLKNHLKDKDMALSVFDFTTKYKDYAKENKKNYDSKKKMKKSYIMMLLDALPDAITFVIRYGHIKKPAEIQNIKSMIIHNICYEPFTAALTEELENGYEIDKIEFLPIIIREILQTTNEINKSLLEKDPESEIYDMSDVANVSKIILKKKMKKMKKAGIPEDLAFDVLSIIPDDSTLDNAAFFRIRSLYDTLYEHAKSKKIPVDKIMDILLSDKHKNMAIVFALLERKEKLTKLDDNQKSLYLDITTWCFNEMENSGHGVIRGILNRYIDVRKKDDQNKKDSNRRYVLSSLIESEYPNIYKVIQDIIEKDESNKKYI